MNYNTYAETYREDPDSWIPYGLDELQEYIQRMEDAGIRVLEPRPEIGLSKSLE